MSPQQILIWFDDYVFKMVLGLYYAADTDLHTWQSHSTLFKHKTKDNTHTLKNNGVVMKMIYEKQILTQT
jgi:hypothetical protein